MSVLLDLVREGDEESVRDLVQRSPELAQARGWALDTTPLHVAADLGRLRTVGLLIAAGADIDAREGASASVPMHWAARAGHPAIVDALLGAGADLEARDGWYGLTPLGWATVIAKEPAATEEGRAACARALLEAGAGADGFTAVALDRPDALAEEDVHARLEFAGDGDSPLHLAVRLGRPRAAERLLELGGDPSAGNFLGASPRSLAVGGPLEALLQGEDPATALFRGDAAAARRCDPRLTHEAIRLGRHDALRALLRGGADPDLRVPALIGDDREQITPLHRAAGHGAVEAVRILLEAGADPDLHMTGSGATALHRAASVGRLRVVEVLLEGGANPMLCDGEHGVDPAAWADYFGHTEVAARLRRALAERSGATGP